MKEVQKLHLSEVSDYEGEEEEEEIERYIHTHLGVLLMTHC